jgi:Adenovirus E3 region protein CR2
MRLVIVLTVLIHISSVFCPVNPIICIDGCSRCTTTSNCSQCKNTHWLSSSPTSCKLCNVEGCTGCGTGGIGCTGCLVTFLYNGSNSCAKCTTGCDTCKNTSTCETCTSGWSIDPDQKCKANSIPGIDTPKAKVGLIVGVLVGILVLIVIGIVLCCYFCCRRKTNLAKTNSTNLQNGTGNPVVFNF